MPILNMSYTVNQGGANIGEPSDLVVTSSGLDATITWTDNDLNTIPPSTFSRSVLVRKIGSTPTTPTDGTLVVTETVKDTYKTIGYVDSGLTDGETYYYKVFSYSDSGGITYCEAVNVTISAGRLPAEYQAVEYIESSGTQYIETGYSSNSTYFKAEYKINMTNLKETGNNPAFPFGVVEGGQIYQTFRNPTSPADTQWGAGNSDLFSTQITALTDYEIMAEWNNGTLNTNINGTTNTQSYSGSLGSHTIPIFCRWRNKSQGYNYNAKMKLYYFKMYSSSNTLVRDLVPCYRKLDSVIGMYDTVNNVFYTNQGTGTFTKGPDVN